MYGQVAQGACNQDSVLEVGAVVVDGYSVLDATLSRDWDRAGKPDVVRLDYLQEVVDRMGPQADVPVGVCVITVAYTEKSRFLPDGISEVGLSHDCVSDIFRIPSSLVHDEPNLLHAVLEEVGCIPGVTAASIVGIYEGYSEQESGWGFL